VGYTPPELIAGEREHVQGPPADTYSLACILFEMVTGTRPFQGSPMQVLWGHLKSEPPHVSEHVPDAPPALDTVVRKGMAKDPQDRHTSAGEFGREALAAARRGE
jgi:serine/threonine-protein kinase